jgi:hypothetical protein
VNDTKFKTVLLGDSVFRFLPEKTSWTKAIYREMDTDDPEDLPVFTATLRPVAFVKKQDMEPIYASPQSPVISFGANGDGSAGTNLVYHERPFYVSNDRTCIQVVERTISPKFLYHELQGMKGAYGFDFQYKATPNNASLVSLEVPIDQSGNFDVDAQHELILRREKEECFKQNVKELRREVSESVVSIDAEFVFRDLEIGDTHYFDTSIGQRVLKRDLTADGIPVYSANVLKPFGFVEKSIIDDFSKPSLLWGIDGNFDWNLVPANSPFMPTDHCGVLRVLTTDILPEYALFVLRATRERYGFDRTLRASLTNINDIVLSVPTVNGKISLSAQRDLAQRYRRLENARESVVNALDQIASASVTY